MPGGKAFFVEVKTTGKKPTKLQAAVHRILRELGFQVFVVDSEQTLQETLTRIDDEVRTA